jgi:hypothetical protein
MVFDNLGVGEDVGEGRDTLLLRQHRVQLLSGEGIVENAEQAVALREVVVDQQTMLLNFFFFVTLSQRPNKLKHLSLANLSA